MRLMPGEALVTLDNATSQLSAHWKEGICCLMKTGGEYMHGAPSPPSSWEMLDNAQSTSLTQNLHSNKILEMQSGCLSYLLKGRQAGLFETDRLSLQ